MPQNKLLSYLSKLPKPVGIETPDVSTIKVGGQTLVSTLDFFYPLVESPYMFGRIAFCNTVSDLYAMGVTDIQEVLMILGVSTDMTEDEKDVSTSMMIQGFTDAATQAKAQVGGGQTVYNQWPMMGGCAIAVVKDDGYVMPNHAQPGDVLILTKPLGTRFAINAMQWLKTNKEKREKILTEASESELIEAYYRAEEQMGTLSLVGAELIRKYQVGACTDVTGFGILGHANYLAQAQKLNLEFVINRLPVYKGLVKIENKVQNFKFFEGYAAETSGGLLMSVSPSKKEALMKELSERGINSW